MTDIDWATQPSASSFIEDFITELRARDEKNATHDYTGDTNLVAGTIRYNRGTQHWEEYDGVSAWTLQPFYTYVEDHINDVEKHTSVPVGGIIVWPCAITGNPPAATEPPARFLWCNGDVVSRTTYANLFSKIGTTYGAGDGSTTFKLPDLRLRVVLGALATQPGAVLADQGGAFNHMHTGGSHSHNVASHSHDMGNHTHTGGSHVHALNDHNHAVGGHFHSTTGSGANISIDSSGGSHRHNLNMESAAHSGQVGDIPLSGNTTANLASTVAITTNSISNHGHAHSTFSGSVGNVTGGANGDSGFNTSNVNGGAGNTQAGGGVATGAPSSNTTSSVSLVTDAGGGGTSTDGNNPPYTAMNFIIRY